MAGRTGTAGARKHGGAQRTAPHSGCKPNGQEQLTKETSVPCTTCAESVRARQATRVSCHERRLQRTNWPR
eukprot:13619673-Alexandrium_andersonii.AAC.1